MNPVSTVDSNVALRVKAFFTLTLAFFMSSAISAEHTHPDNMTAREIIDRMQSTYANSRTYRDSGVVEMIFTGSVNQTIRKPFTTAFVRPDRFRYAFEEKKPGGQDRVFIIHREGESVQAYWTLQDDLKFESLDRAVAAATGVSNGSAVTVPAMLLPEEITWRRGLRFNQPQRIDDQNFEGADCFRLQDLILSTIPATFWIDKKTMLLKKIYREQQFENFRTRETTVYRPILDAEMSTRSLDFNAPSRE
jgi:hypothetical protein